MPAGEVHTNLPTGTFFVYCIIKFEKVPLNYTLSQLRDRVNDLIKVQGEDAHCDRMDLHFPTIAQLMEIME